MVPHSLWTQFGFYLKAQKVRLLLGQVQAGASGIAVRTHFQGVPGLTLVHVTALEGARPRQTSPIPGPFHFPWPSRQVPCARPGRQGY